MRTIDPDLANLEVTPLLNNALQVRVTSAQTEPEYLGWKVVGKPLPATTVQHLRKGKGTVRFVTLLLPLRAGQEHGLRELNLSDPEHLEARLEDGRMCRVHVPASVSDQLSGEITVGPRGG